MLTCPDTIPGLDPIAQSATSHVHWQHAVREIAPCELGRFEFHLLRLDPCCRRLRFSSPVPDDYIRAYVLGISGTTSVILGCFINGWLRGAAELRSPDTDWGAESEIAFSVERAWQGRGIGTALMASVIEAARMRGIERLHLSFGSVNHRMGAIARKVAVGIDMANDECVANVNRGGGVIAPSAATATTSSPRRRGSTPGLASLSFGVVDCRLRGNDAGHRGVTCDQSWRSAGARTRG